MRNNFVRYGTIYCCALLLLAGSGCRTNKHVTTTATVAEARVTEVKDTTRGDTVKADVVSLQRDSTQELTTSRNFFNYFFGYDSAGRIERVTGYSSQAQASNRANTQMVQATADVATTSHHAAAAVADTTKREGQEKATQETEAGGNALSAIDRGLEVGVAVTLGVVALVFCAWVVYRLRKLNEKWEQRNR